MPPLVHDIGISLLLAGVLAIVCARLKIPSIAAFLLAGVLAGPLVLRQVTDPENIDTIAQLGFVLLLFMIGLEIDIRSILKSGRTIIVAGLLQYPLTILFGFAAAKLLALIGLGALIEGNMAPFYIGVVIAGSSTIQVVKLFQEHFELDTEPGRIALSILIFQDIWAIVVTLLQPNLGHPEPLPIVFSFVGIGLLILLGVLLARFGVSYAFRWISKVPELILLGAISWCFVVVFLGTNLDAITEAGFGINLHMTVGPGMSALIAGATIANLPYSTEVITKVGIVKDFFVTLFFVGLGIAIPAPDGWSVPLLALGMAVVAIIARQLVFFPLLYLLGVDQRNSEVSSIRLAQISEFGLVIAFLGVEQGHISPDLNAAIILAFVLTALATTPLYQQAYALHELFRPWLSRLGFKEPPASEEEKSEEYAVAILGLHRDASSLLHEIAKRRPELLPRILVIDFNVALHDRIREMGVNVEYGDISNDETLLHAGIDKAKIVVCTISDDLLRGITNRELVKTVRKLNPGAVIIANAVDMKNYEAVERAGADYVYMARLEVAEALSELLGEVLAGRLKDYKAGKAEARGPMDQRREVLS